jgi:UDP-glucose 4-epimerase
LIHKTLQNQEIQIWANPENVRDYIFIDDCVSAVFKLIESNAEGIFNISSGIGLSLNEIISVVQELFSYELKLSFVTNSAKEESVNVLDNRKIIEQTGWRPQIDIKNGVSLTHHFLKNNNF